MPPPSGFVPDGFVADTPTAPQQAAIGAGGPTAAVAAGVPLLQRIAAEVGTNPNVPRMTATFGRVLGGLTPIVASAAGAIKTGNPLDLAGMAGAAGGAWGGGKTGWYTGKLLQQLARPVASGLERITPYLEQANPLSGAAGLGDVAQIAEPKRRDIGFMGIGPSVNVPGAKPALLNALWQKITGQ